MPKVFTICPMTKKNFANSHSTSWWNFESLTKLNTLIILHLYLQQFIWLLSPLPCPAVSLLTSPFVHIQVSSQILITIYQGGKKKKTIEPDHIFCLIKNILAHALFQQWVEVLQWNSKSGLCWLEPITYVDFSIRIHPILEEKKRPFPVLNQ